MMRLPAKVDTHNSDMRSENQVVQYKRETREETTENIYHNITHPLRAISNFLSSRKTETPLNLLQAAETMMVLQQDIRKVKETKAEVDAAARYRK
jgi:hypothetical protein